MSGFGEQLVTIGRPFVITADGNVVTSQLIDYEQTIGANAERLGLSALMLARLITAEKAWERANDPPRG